MKKQIGSIKEITKKLIQELIQELKAVNRAIADFERLLEAKSRAKGARSKPNAGAKSEALSDVKRKQRPGI
jgi:hypothetical protein